jgi:hypothetical protein
VNAWSMSCTAREAAPDPDACIESVRIWRAAASRWVVSSSRLRVPPRPDAGGRLLAVPALLGSVALALSPFSSRPSSPSSVRHLVLANAVTGAVDRAFPDADGDVRTAVSEGRGGWYVGGDFEHVGDAARPFLARLASDGVLRAAFAPRLRGEVSALARRGAVVFAGGVFGVAALDARTGRRIWMTRAVPVGGSLG